MAASKPSRHSEPPPAHTPSPGRLEVSDTIVLPSAITQQPRPWEPRSVEPRPELDPFDQKKALAKLTKLRLGYHGYYGVDWKACTLPISMTRDEALFWLEAFVRANEIFSQQLDQPHDLSKALTKQLSEAMADFTPTPLTADQVLDKAYAGWCSASGQIAVVLAALAPLERFVEVLDFPPPPPSDYHRFYTHWGVFTYACHSFCAEVLPYYSDAELEPVRAKLRSKLAALDWRNHQSSHSVVKLLVNLRMSREMADLLANRSTLGLDGVEWQLVSNLDSPEAVLAASKQAKIRFTQADQVWRWLYLTGTRDLEPIREAVLSAKSKQQCAKLIEAAGCVRSPAMAALMLEFAERSVAPSTAAAWLAEEVGNAIAALVPIAADGKHKRSSVAVRYLNEQRKLGRVHLIEPHLVKLTEPQAQRLRKLVLDVQDRTYPTHTTNSLPTDLAQALSAPLPSKFNLPKWLSLVRLSPLVIAQKRLSDEQVRDVIALLITHKGDGPPAIIELLRQHVQPRMLETFALDIFDQLESNRETGATVKWVWSMLAAVGSDETAVRLGGYARSLVAAKQTAAAMTVANALAQLPNDSALIQLHRMGQVAKSPALKHHIKQLLDGLAKALNLTTDELSDRVVPTLDLDERGTRTFDFGPRKFSFVLTGDLKPAVRDEAGKVRAELPKANAKDDPDLAAAAHSDWKTLKASLRETLKVQVRRMELAMINERSWSLADFMHLFVEHPLMTHLTQRVIWSLIDQQGKQRTCFRLTSERTFSDVEDDTITLDPACRVCLPHPLHIPANQRHQWLRLLADYEILEPFPQLSRPVYVCEPSEANATELTRFGTFSVATGSLTALVQSGLWKQLHSYPARIVREFTHQQVRAVLEFEPGYFWEYGQIDYEAPQTLKPLVFRPLTAKHQDSLLMPDGKLVGLPLGQIPPIAFSEACRELAHLAAKRRDFAKEA